MNNFTEDLTGLSRADLVYKAKLAEQAERCAFRSPACPYHFRQKLQKASSRSPLLGRDWRARVGVPGRAVPIPRPSDALLRVKDTADDSHPSFLGDLADRIAHRGARSGTRSRARDIVFRPLSGSLGVPRWSSGRPWRAHAGATPRAGDAGAVIRRGSGLPGAVKGARARPGATARRPAPDRARVPAPAPSASPPDLAVP